MNEKVHPYIPNSAPESFAVLKFEELATDVRIKNDMAIGEPRSIGGEDPSVERHDGRAIYTFRTTGTVVSFISAEYIPSRTTENEIDYRVYLFPEYQEMLNETMNLAQELIELYSERYCPYPLKEFRVVGPLGGD